MNINDITPQRLNELSPATLASYKKKAGAAATAADAAGDTKTGNKRFSGIVKATKKQFDQDAKGVSEGKADYNFDIEDLKRLERIRDLATLKTQAMMLISKPSAKPMRPEKVEWFRNALEKMNSPLKVIKLMYDLLLSGEGHSVVGSRSSMNPNSYRQRFNEQDAAEDSLAGMKRLAGIAKANKTNEAAPPGYDTATGKPLPPEARFDPNTGKPLPGVSPAPAAAAAPKQPWLPTSNKSKEAAYAAANKAKAAAPVAAPTTPAAAAPVAAPAAATPPRDTSKSIYDGDTGELTAYGAELKAKEKVDRQAAYAAAEANKAKAAPAAAPAAAPVAAPAAPTTTGMFQPRTTSPATNPAGKKVDIVQAAKAATAAGGNPEAAAIAAMKAKNPKLAAMMAQAGLDDQGNDIAAAPAAPAAPAPVAEDSLAGMKRLAGIAPVQTQTIPGQRQYRHMPTAVQPQ
jgi:hypothetical protein